MPTFCEDCDNVHRETRKRSPMVWLCVKFPRLEGQGFVAPKVWTEQEPYMRCVGINGGACCLFTKRRDGQTELNLPPDPPGWESRKISGGGTLVSKVITDEERQAHVSPRPK